MTPDLPQELEAEVVILSSVCGKHFDDDCQSCALAKQSNDERVTRTPAVATDGGVVERVARAIADARAWQNTRLTRGDWDNRDESEREPFLNLARAAILAIQEGVGEHE